jgi:hypothetical protein
MRLRDIDKIAEIILASGVGTKTQREAIVQRIYDWHKYESQYGSAGIS